MFPAVFVSKSCLSVGGVPNYINGSDDSCAICFAISSKVIRQLKAAMSIPFSFKKIVRFMEAKTPFKSRIEGYCYWRVCKSKEYMNNI